MEKIMRLQWSWSIFFFLAYNLSQAIHLHEALKVVNPSIMQDANQPSNSQQWFTCNFSLKYPSTIQQTDNESTQMYQVEVVILI